MLLHRDNHSVMEGAMRNFILGIVLGSLLTGGLGLAASGTWGSKGLPGSQGPSGSQAQYDYFRQRQQWLDLRALRQQMAEERMQQMTRPCAK